MKRFLLAVALVMSVSCAELPQTVPAKQCKQRRAGVPGWYKVELGPWTPSLNWGNENVLITPPPKIQLTGESFSSSILEQRAYTVTSPDHPVGSEYSYWNWIDPQTIEITWTEGYGGLHMRLKPDGADLKGVVSTFWEFRRMTQRAPVRLVWLPCEQ